MLGDLLMTGGEGGHRYSTRSRQRQEIRLNGTNRSPTCVQHADEMDRACIHGRRLMATWLDASTTTAMLGDGRACEDAVQLAAAAKAVTALEHRERSPRRLLASMPLVGMCRPAE